MTPAAADEPPRVSVVMSVWKPQAELLRAAVQSVLEQTLDDLELVILEDPPHGVVEQVLAGLPDGRIRHLRSRQRTSLAASRNRTLELARADLVAILDADDVCMPDRLRVQAEWMRAHPEVTVLGTQIRVLTADGRVRGFHSYPTTHEGIVRAMRRYNPIAHPTAMLRGRAVLATGGYRDRNGAACEDYELWSRLARDGHRFANLPQALLDYRLHGGSTKTVRTRETLRDTLWVKRTYWSDRMSLRDRLRVMGEGVLLRLPPSLIQRLFLRATVSPRLRIRDA